VTTKSGALTLTAATALPPITMGGRNAAVVGFAGSKITSAITKLPPLSATNITDALKNTLIAFVDRGKAKIFSYGTQEVSELRDPDGFVDVTTLSFSGDGGHIAETFLGTLTFGGQVVVATLDGTGVPVGNHSVNPQQAAISPDGTKIAYIQTDAVQDCQVALVSASGGATTFLTNLLEVPVNPVWSPDGKKIVYFSTKDFDTYVLKSIAVSPGGVDIPTFSIETDLPPFVTFLGGDPGDIAVSSVLNGTTTVQRLRNGSTTFLAITKDSIQGISGSPVGKFLLLGDDSTGKINLMNCDVPPFTQTPLISGGDVPNWGPYVQSKPLLGTGGVLGSTAGAVLYGAAGSMVGGILAVDATNESSIQIQTQGNPNPTQSIIFANVTGTNLTSLKYVNGMYGSVVTVLNGADPNVAGAVVSFDADTGNVLSVVTYAAALAKANGVYTGKILSAFDAKGKNIAPNGARRATFDTTSGKLLSVN